MIDNKCAYPLIFSAIYDPCRLVRQVKKFNG